MALGVRYSSTRTAPKIVMALAMEFSCLRIILLIIYSSRGPRTPRITDNSCTDPHRNYKGSGNMGIRTSSAAPLRTNVSSHPTRCPYAAAHMSSILQMSTRFKRRKPQHRRSVPSMRCRSAYTMTSSLRSIGRAICDGSLRRSQRSFPVANAVEKAQVSLSEHFCCQKK